MGSGASPSATVVHIVGRKNNGKTTLIVQLLRELTRRGVRVGTVKHTSHHHELDTPGKDSHDHRLAGAAPVAVITPELAAAYIPRRAQVDPYQQLEPMFSDCQLVLVEGDHDRAGLKVEVWRQSMGTQPLCLERDDVAAVITDDPLDAPAEIWPRSDMAEILARLACLVRLDLDPAGSEEAV